MKVKKFGVGEIIDYMLVEVARGKDGDRLLIRLVKVVSGAMSFEMECYLAFDLTRDNHRTEVTQLDALFHSSGFSMKLGICTPLKLEGRGELFWSLR